MTEQSLKRFTIRSDTPCVDGLSPDCPFPDFPASNGVVPGLYWFTVFNQPPRQFFADGLGFILVGSSTLNGAANYGTVPITTPILKGDNVIYEQAAMFPLTVNGAADVKITSDNYPLTPPGNVEQVISTTGFPITRVNLYLSLSGTPASVLGSDNWSGNTTRLDRTCVVPADGPAVPLSQVIYVACGNGAGMSWAQGGGSHWDQGNAPAGGLNLWIR